MQFNLDKLKGRYVYLQTLKPEHKESLRDLAKDERLWEFTKRFRIDDTYNAQFDEYFAIAIDPKALGRQQAFVIHSAVDGKLIGMTRFTAINETDKNLEIGWTWYIPSVWGKVHNRECKLLLLQYVFEELHFLRAEFRVAHQNIRSQKAIEKIGAVKEAVLRKHGYRPDGALKDTVIFSIIDDEWPVKKEKLIQLIAKSEND
jgi:N-acetyltransferase